MSQTGWGYYMQDNQITSEIDGLGSKLSIVIGCPVHYPAFGKNLFECKCGVIFPIYFLKGHTWEEIKEFHSKERSLALGRLHIR